MKATARPARKRTPPLSPPPKKAGATAPAEERRLVEAAQNDPAKFDALYELHFDRVYGFVAGRVHDRVTAEDVTSEVFYKALANLKTYEWRGVPFAGWLLRIAANAVIDRAQRAFREHPLTDEPHDPNATADEITGHAGVARATPGKGAPPPPCTPSRDCARAAAAAAPGVSSSTQN